MQSILCGEQNRFQISLLLGAVVCLYLFLLLLSAPGGALRTIQDPWSLNTHVQYLYRGCTAPNFTILHHIAPYCTMGFPSLGLLEGPRMAPGNPRPYCTIDLISLEGSRMADGNPGFTQPDSPGRLQNLS